MHNVGGLLGRRLKSFQNPLTKDAPESSCPEAPNTIKLLSVRSYVAPWRCMPIEDSVECLLCIENF